MSNDFPFDEHIQNEEPPAMSIPDPTEREEAHALLEARLTDWEQKILLSLIDIGHIESYPDTVDDAVEAVDTVEVFRDNFNDFIVTHKPY